MMIAGEAAVEAGELLESQLAKNAS